MPAIVARFDAEQGGLKAEQARMQREFDATTKKIGRLRVDQALADYSISELRKAGGVQGSLDRAGDQYLTFRDAKHRSCGGEDVA